MTKSAIINCYHHINIALGYCAFQKGVISLATLDFEYIQFIIFDKFNM